jgi:hypothetical protein
MMFLQQIFSPSFLPHLQIYHFSWCLQEIYKGNKISRAHVHVKNHWPSLAHVDEFWLIKNFSVIWELCTDVETTSLFREIKDLKKTVQL